MTGAVETGKVLTEKASARMLSEIGQPSLITSNSFVNELKKKDLKHPNCYFTFDQMVQDPSVSEPLTITKALETNALSAGFFEGTGSRLSKELADYGNFIIHNMKYMSWHEAVLNINSHIKNGMSLNEIVASSAKGGKYKGDIVLDHLGPRSPKSIKAIVWDEYGRRVKGFVQQPLKTSDITITQPYSKYLGSITYRQYLTNTDIGKYPYMPMEKLLHNVYDAEMSNPQGNSPLIAAFCPWQEKKIIGEYEIIGVTRNLGGIPVARVPDELLIRGADPLNHPEDYQALNDIQTDLENVHAGRQAFFILPSSLVEGSTSLFQYNIELLKGGGSDGKSDVSDIIKRKTTEIYNAFNAGHLNLGQNGNTSSYSLAEAGTSSHAIIVERDLMSTVNVINSIIPKLLDIRKFEYDKRDLPVFRWKTPDQLSLDEVGKFIQRVKSVQGMTPDMLKKVLDWGNLPMTGVEDIDFTDKGDSRSGESKGSSGTGNTQKGGKTSSTNMENKQMLHYRQEDLGDQLAILDENDNLVQIIEKE